MANFPNLKPAFTALFEIGDPSASVGDPSADGPLTYVKVANGTFKSVPSFGIKLDATVVNGGDWVHVLPSGEYLALDISGIAETDDNAIFSFSYPALIPFDSAMRLILSGSPEAKTTEFGNLFTHKIFKTGSAKYKFLEENIFIGSGRFVVGPADQGRKLSVEYNVSQVIA